MVTYRHKILLQKIRSKIKPEDIQSAKLVLLFVLMFSVISFFALRIVDTINRGIDSQSQVESIASKVEKLEKQNQLLRSEKEAAISESEIEAQYRAMGFKKPGEEVYIISRNASPTPSEATEVTVTDNSPKLSNWEKWVLLIFN